MPRRLLFALFGALMCLSTAPAGDLQDFALRCLKANAGTTTVRILQFGDSHLALPNVQRMYRGVFQAQFGDGGAGFGLPWAKAQAGFRAQASSGWRRLSAQGAESGLLDASLVAVRAGETASLEGAFSRLRIHFLRLPGGGSAKILVDGTLLDEISLRGDAPELTVFDRSVPGARRLEVVTSSPGPVRILGLSLEEPTGAVHSCLAGNGLQASWLLGIPESLFAAQVKAEAPDLVILAFGTNEANDRLFEPGRYRKDLETLLARFEQAAPSATLVLLGPPDARLPRSRPGALEQVIEIQNALASQHGAFFWDQRNFMGGAGSIGSWQQAGLANRDLVHFNQEGYQRLAKGFLERFFERLGQPPLDSLRQDPGRARAGGRPIYVFKTRDGRTIITDDPANVAGEQGEWEGSKPE